MFVGLIALLLVSAISIPYLLLASIVAYVSSSVSSSHYQHYINQFRICIPSRQLCTLINSSYLYLVCATIFY